MSDTASFGRLVFEGLATVADAWLNGTHILHSENMFVANAVNVSGLLRDENELRLRFHALTPLLATARPRPRWRTALVSHQQLRWYRTTLLGRMPAWCPAVAPVGPWRPIRLEAASPITVDDADVHVALDGDDGLVSVSVKVTCGAADDLKGMLHVAGYSAQVRIERPSNVSTVLQATVRVPRVERWWPHTHGPQPMYAARLSVECAGDSLAVDFGRLGFRDLYADQGADGERFGLVINGVPVFCRGVCWTPLDVAGLNGDSHGYRLALEQLRDAGVNMVRVGGTMVYETAAFHDLCDELGILVWQDFMFANMDYPAADEAFAASVTAEAAAVIRRLRGRPSTAVFCGSSEVYQQAAMLGLTREKWQSALFDGLLPHIVNSLAPDVPWVPSTPAGGTLPFHADRGVTHYYGVGAYRRPFEDARRANVQFASECLAFSNVPDPAMVDALRSQGAAPGHDPQWKAGVPRDAGAGWDFEDVRDHYVRLLFGVDPGELRARDIDRYLELGRVATGEAMLRTFAEWRRPGSSCRGGLVWFAHDLRSGAGWGIVDANGQPKAAYWFLKRAFAPVALAAIDEGLNGLWLHALNDTEVAVDTELRVALYRHGRPQGTRVSRVMWIPARGSVSVHADAMFDGFADLTYAYRFGPPGHDVVAATLKDRATGATLASAHLFPCGLPTARDSALRLSACAEPADDGYAVTVTTDRFALAVAIDADGFVPDDNYAHLAPGEPMRIRLRAARPGPLLRASVSALNGTAPVVIVANAPGEVRYAS